MCNCAISEKRTNMRDVLLFNRHDVKNLLRIEECIHAVEDAFRAYSTGRAQPPGILGVPFKGGGFHIKAGIMELTIPYFVAKTNSNFLNNRASGLPTIQGIVAVFDASNGRMLALMDSIEVTTIRTGAATAVAAKYLARENVRTMLTFGCGIQGRISIEAISKVRDIDKVFVYDSEPERSARFAEELWATTGIVTEAVRDPFEVSRVCGIIVTCTTATRFFLRREHVSPGTFIAAVGADSEEKQELEPELFAASKIVTDITAQCASIGELHHAISGGFATRSDVFSELGDIVAGTNPGRTGEDEIIVFDSTGMALQDVAAASIVFERAMEAKAECTKFDFNSFKRSCSIDKKA